MPVDAGGNITRPASPIPVSGQTADAPQVNVPVDDIYAWGNLLMFLDGRKSWRGDQNANGYKIGGAANATSAQDYVTLSQMQDAIAAVSFLFPGFLQADTATSSVAPQGWVYANGQELSRSAYPQLWARVSAGNNLAASQGAKTAGQYGPGNGTTTFTVPNLYADGGYFIRPLTAGRGIGSIQQDEFKEHTHTASTASAGAHTHDVTQPVRRGANGNHFPRGWDGGDVQLPGTHTAVTTSNGAHTHAVTVNNTGGTETRPRNIAYPVLIKT